MRCSVLRVFAVAIWSFLFMPASVFAQAAEPATRPAAPGFLNHFGPEHTTILYVHDPLPHVKKVLHDPDIRRLVRDGRLGRILSGARPGAAGAAGADPVDAWPTVEAASPWIPREVAIGLSDQSMQQFDRLVRVFLVGGLCAGATEADEKAGAGVHGKLLDDFAANITELRVPPMRIYVRFRAARDAQALMGILQFQLRASFPNQKGLDVAEDGLSIKLRMSLGDLLDKEVLLQLMEDAGVLGDAEQAKTEAIAATAAKLPLEATCRLVGDAMILDIGAEPPAPVPPAAAAAAKSGLNAGQLGDLFVPEPELLVWSRWDFKVLKQAAGQWIDLWTKWEATPVGRALADIDTDGSIGDLKLMAGQLRSMADRGALRLRYKDGLRATMREEGTPAATAIAGSSVLSLVPNDAEAFGISGASNLGEALSYLLMQVESRMDLQALKEWDRPGKMQAMSDDYYTKFKQFRGLMHDIAPTKFKPPFGWVASTRGKVDSFRLKVMDGGPEQKMEGRDLPVMEFAMIGAAPDVQESRATIEKIWTRLAEDSWAAAGKKAPLPKAVEQADLGLGVPTWALRGQWLIGLLPEEYKASLEMQGDIEAHVFVVDDMVVLSTSPKLSKRMLAARTEKKIGRLAIADQQMVGRTWIGREVIGGYFTQAGDWIAMFVRGMDEPVRTRMTELPEILKSFGEWTDLAGDISVQVTRDGAVQTTEFLWARQEKK